jgi:hypothetical protein
MLGFKGTKLGPTPDLFITTDCPEFIRQFRNLWYEEKVYKKQKVGYKEEPAKIEDDFIDCLCYIVAARPKRSGRAEIINCGSRGPKNRTGY